MNTFTVDITKNIRKRLLVKTPDDVSELTFRRWCVENRDALFAFEDNEPERKNIKIKQIDGSIQEVEMFLQNDPETGLTEWCVCNDTTKVQEAVNHDK